MLIQEFIDKHCPELRTIYEDKSHILDDIDLPYDDIIEDESGQRIKVVYCGETAIPITDIITSTREDFARLYPDFECREMFDRYMETLIVLEGEDAINHIKNVMESERKRVQAFNEENSLSKMLW